MHFLHIYFWVFILDQYIQYEKLGSLWVTASAKSLGQCTGKVLYYLEQFPHNISQFPDGFLYLAGSNLLWFLGACLVQMRYLTSITSLSFIRVSNLLLFTITLCCALWQCSRAQWGQSIYCEQKTAHQSQEQTDRDKWWGLFPEEIIWTGDKCCKSVTFSAHKRCIYILFP